jgi:hypothetical protein
MADEKICSVCKLPKPLKDFYKKLNGKSHKCKACTKISNTLYRASHKDKLSQYGKDYYLSHKEELIQYAKDYRSDVVNKQIICNNKKIYFEKNREAIYKSKNKRRKFRRNNDPFYRLRNLVSRSVSRMLKSTLSKKGGSIKNKLPYSIQELKEHLEAQFESWMHWNNQGKYNPKTWIDNDQNTWTWQVDHIIPQSDLPYVSMEDDNFKKCWALDNLRPLSSKMNIIEGSNHLRHK